MYFCQAAFTERQTLRVGIWIALIFTVIVSAQLTDLWNQRRGIFLRNSPR